MTTAESDIMTLQEASRCLFVDPRTIQKWAGSGKIEPVTVGRTTYFTRSSIIKAGMERGMTEDQVLNGQLEAGDPSDAVAEVPGPPRFRPTVWPSVSNRVCARCGKSTPRGWCVSCGGDYD